MSLIFTRSITLTIAIGTSEKTATHDLDTSVQSLLICIVSLDGDSYQYGQVVRTAKKEYEQIYSHPDAINSIPHHTSIYTSHMNKLQNPKQSISLYAHPDQKLNMIALVPC
jgi:hypothetical protein